MTATKPKKEKKAPKAKVTFLFTLPELQTKAIELMIALSKREITGEEKLEETLDELAKWADSRIEFRKTLGGAIGEAVDQPLIRGFLALVAQAEFLRLRANKTL